MLTVSSSHLAFTSFFNFCTVKISICGNGKNEVFHWKILRELVGNDKYKHSASVCNFATFVELAAR